MSPSFEQSPRFSRRGEPDPGDIDDRLLDRLVDGELSQDEYRRLLASLDETPDGWRRCALAFLEHQALGCAFMSPVAAVAPACRAGANPAPSAALADVAPACRAGVPPAPGAAHVDVAPACRAGAPLAPNAAHVDVAPACRAGAPLAPNAALVDVAPACRAGAPPNPRKPIPSATKTAIAWLAVAASWLAVFVTGWQWSAHRHESRVSPTRDDHASHVAPAPKAGAVRTEERPLQSEFVEQLRQGGHDLQVRDHYIPVQLNDGREFIFPVRELNVAPIRRVAY